MHRAAASRAIPIILVWPLIVEGIVGEILNEISEGSQKWMPFRDGTRMGLIDVEADLDAVFSRTGAGSTS